MAHCIFAALASFASPSPSTSPSCFLLFSATTAAGTVANVDECREQVSKPRAARGRASTDRNACAGKSTAKRQRLYDPGAGIFACVFV